KVTADIENRFHFNTAISAVMELVNEINQFLNAAGPGNETDRAVVREAVETTVILLSPVVPHVAEELWRMLGHEETLLNVSWPVHREEALAVETRLVVLQVNGKVRSRVQMPVSATREELEAAALSDERVRRFIGDKPVRKVIVVQQKLVNVVV
ncbi:MAG: leucine--tRNA ligase, partial [Deltaproteobacteria bacterium]